MDTNNYVSGVGNQMRRDPTQVNPNTGRSNQTQINPRAGVSDNAAVPGRPDTLINSNVEQNYISRTGGTGSRVSAGTVIDGRYQIMAPMSSDGAEAELYICASLETGKELCIKFYLDSDHVRENVRDTLLGISHRNISNLVSWGYWEGRAYEVWTLYRGQNLADAIRRRCLGEVQINTYVRQMNSALHELHIKGLVHQDIKPSNFMVMADGSVILIDFGISALGGDGGRTHVTKVGNTTDYSPPEVLLSNFCWPASDYYSLGVTIYEMLSGTTPYSDYDESMLFRKIDDMRDTRIPHIEKFSQKVQDLIVGLLQYDHKLRWGYEAVQAWLSGDYSKYKRPTAHRSTYGQEKEFMFSGKKYMIPSQIPELVTSMAFNWRDGINFLDGKGCFVRLRDLLNGMEGVDDLWSICNETKPDVDTDLLKKELFYFEKLYKLYPQLTLFAWHGFVAKGSKELGEAILNALWQHEIQEEARDSTERHPSNPFTKGYVQRNTELTYADLEIIFTKHIVSLYLTAQNAIELRDQILAYEQQIADERKDTQDAKVWYYKIGYTLSGSTKLRLGPRYYEDKNAFVNRVNIVIEECKSSGNNDSFIDFCQLIYNTKMNAGFSAWADAQGFGDAVTKLESALKERSQ